MTNTARELLGLSVRVDGVRLGTVDAVRFAAATAATEAVGLATVGPG